MIAIQYRQFKKFYVTFDLYPDKKFDASLKEISKKSEGSAGLPVTLVLKHKNSPNNEYKIVPGLSCSVMIEANEATDDETAINEKGILVPISSVYEVPDTKEKYVWIVNSETLEVTKRTVKTGSLAGKDLIYVMGGIEKGEQLVTAGGNLLAENQKVKFIVSQENL
jgi:multidrug efflux system membrane fusion protein